jgi:hypothetical protein
MPLRKALVMPLTGAASSWFIVEGCCRPAADAVSQGCSRMEIDPLIGDKIERRRWRKSDDGRVRVEDQEGHKKVEINWECSDRMYSMASPASLGILWMVWSPTVVRLNAEKPQTINRALRQSEAQWVSQPWKAASSDIACSLICIQIKRTKHIISMRYAVLSCVSIHLPHLLPNTAILAYRFPACVSKSGDAFPLIPAASLP